MRRMAMSFPTRHAPTATCSIALKIASLVAPVHVLHSARRLKRSPYSHMPSAEARRIESTLATDLSVSLHQISAAVALLDAGSTVPFIARYRKEATGGLDDAQLRTLQERLSYLRELEERRASILASIEEQGKLTAPLRAAIEAAETKQRLEDLYLPYKPKRRTKAQLAREAGLDALAASLLANPALSPEVEAAKYLKPAFKTADGDNAGVPDVKSALEGARQVLMEQFAEDAELLS